MFNYNSKSYVEVKLITKWVISDKIMVKYWLKEYLNLTNNSSNENKKLTNY